MRPECDVAIVGGGIVGLATALALARQEPRPAVVLVEKEPRLATHQTGHNSGVIHSGIYYRPGSLKARLAVAGARELLTLCREAAIPHRQCGKVIVATQDEEIPRLEELHRRGLANGVPGIEMIGAGRLRELEPHVRALRALHVPSTAITDFRLVAQHYAAEVEAHGVEIRTAWPVRNARREAGIWVLEGPGERLRARTLVNCAGLHADRVAVLTGHRPSVRIVPFRGEYHRLLPGREMLVRGLVYPVPDPALPFLGVHFTPMIHGGVEVGPNAVLALRREGYRKKALSLRDALDIATWPGFWRMARRYWRTGLNELYRSWSRAALARALQRMVPELTADDLEPAEAGVRAQAVAADGTLIDDFVIERRDGAVHVLNAPSPAATASLPIGAYIASAIREEVAAR